MLTQILEIIYKTRMYSKTNISRDLDIDEDTVEHAVERLINMGYLREDEMSPSCNGTCFGCSIANCNIQTVTTYTLTDKGLDTLSV